MRWALVKVCLAVTAMVVVAFAVPLGLVVKEMARDRAFSNAEREAAAEVRDLVAAGLHGVEAEFRVVRGEPFGALCRVADEIRADAVVVGASTGAGSRLVGWLAVKLVKAGRWPVTVVP